MNAGLQQAPIPSELKASRQPRRGFSWASARKWGVRVSAVFALGLVAWWYFVLRHDPVQDWALPGTGECSFNASISLDVYIVREFGGEHELIGRTPSPQPLLIPKCYSWFVLADRDVDIAQVCRTAREKGIPGLHLGRHSVGDREMELVARLAKLEVLYLSANSEFRDPGYAALSKLKNLRCLSLWSLDEPALDSFRWLNALEKLEMLDLSYSSIDCDHIGVLCELEGLRGLRLCETLIWDDGLQELAGLKHLEHIEVLDLGYEGISDEGLKHLVQFDNLRSLTVGGDEITDLGAEHLRKLKALKILSIWNCSFTDSGFARLGELTSLEALDLRSTDLADDHLLGFAELKSLAALDITSTKVTEQGISRLTDFAALSKLSWGGSWTGKSEELSRLGRTGGRNLARLHGLRELELEDVQIDDAAMEALAELKGLRTLRLGFVRLTDTGLSYLQELRGIRHLELVIEGREITDSGLKHLVGLKGLHELHLLGTAVTDEGLVYLRSLPHLWILHLDGIGITEAGVKELRRVLPQTKITHSEPAPR